MTAQLVTIDVPDNVRDPRRYYDRTVQGWHATLGPSHPALDLDLFGYCPRCAKTVYMIEAAAAPADTKPVRVVAQLALDAGSCALLVEHQDGAITRWRPVVYPPGAEGSTDWHPASSLEQALLRLRELHARRCAA